MSHYAVAVLTKKGQNIDDLMEPFYEGITVAPYIAETKEEIIIKAKEFKESIIALQKEKPDYELNDYERRFIKCNSDEEFYNANTFNHCTYDINGNRLSTYNPNAKWDWYEEGGRFENILKTKTGEHTNSCLVKDLDLSLNMNLYQEALNWWEVVIENNPSKENKNIANNNSLFSKEYYLEKYKTKECYAQVAASFSTYAILFPTGEWFEPGKVGWFGFSNATLEEEINWYLKYSELLYKAEPDWKVTIVDCHI